MKIQPPGPTRIRRAAALPVALAACAALAAPAPAISAVTPQNVGLSTLLQGARDASAHTVAHYLADNGPGFVVDMLAPKPLLRFDNSVELWALTDSQGPRGDTIYKNDMGQVMLRVPRIGGMTVYPPRNTKGIAATFDQPAPRLGVSRPYAQAEFDLSTARAASVLKRSLPNLDSFDVVADAEAPKGKAVDWAAFAIDASNLVAETVNRLSQTPANQKMLAKLTAVRINYGATPTVKLNKTELVIELDPLLGIPGRPSSAKIEAALGVH